ncbi:MAG: PilT/PilU family type 4a pilus ATPase [Eubacterium sp.]|nr:PilT/PilU family type 4a pilus ATPase [Eubacterium sp.]
MELIDILKKSIELGASDIFVVAGLPLTFKANGKQIRLAEEGIMLPPQTAATIYAIYELAKRNRKHIDKMDADDDFSFAISSVGRFRVNVFHQRGSLAAVIRVIRFGLPSAEEMKIPQEVMQVANYKKGIVLVTGQAGSGKSTTLACILDTINHTRDGHILTLEDPVEYVHRHDRCIVSQREIFSDSPSYISALRSALRESPDIILLGEMRDYETMEVAMTAAETGQLLFSSLHTTGAANTVDRIIDEFPANQQAQVRLQLSMVLQAVISQQLVPAKDGTLIPAFEIMFVNLAIRNLIRESKTHQIDAMIASGGAQGMRTMDMSLLQLYQQGVIDKEVALTHCLNFETMQKKLDLISQ